MTAHRPIVPWLTAKEERFCVVYARTRSASQAYRAAYPYGPDEAQVVLASPKIQARIAELMEVAGKSVDFELADVVQRYVDIATADPDELIGLRIGCCRYCHGHGHAYQWRLREYTERCAEIDRDNRLVKDPALLETYPDCSGGFDYDRTRGPCATCVECHGEGVQRIVARDTSQLSPGAALLYQGVKQTKEGIEITVADRTKALDKLYAMFGGATENVNVKALIAKAHPVDAVDLATLTPQAAADVYQEMIAGS